MTCIVRTKQPQSFLLCYRTDLGFITKMVDKEAMDRLRKVASTPFERCAYTRAIELLEEAVKGGKKFEFPVSRRRPDDIPRSSQPTSWDLRRLSHWLW